MRIPFSMATLVASFVVLGISATFSASAARGQEIAVVNIEHIFKNHFYFKSQMESLNEQGKRTETKLRQLREAAEKINIRLRGGQFKIGSKEYRDLQGEYAQAQAKFTVETQESRKWFVEEKSKIYYKVYSEITRAVEAFATRHKITLVLKYTRNDDVDPKNPATVDRMLKSQVVFQNRVDITEAIMKSLPGFKPEFGANDGLDRR